MPVYYWENKYCGMKLRSGALVSPPSPPPPLDCESNASC